MSETATLVPQLTVETQLLSDDFTLIDLVDAQSPLVFLRHGDGIAGLGEVLRLEFSGPDRFTDAAEIWRRIADGSVVHDPVHLPGTGLVAFGAFSFDDKSAMRSVLIVPEIVIGRRGGVSWVTRVNGSTRAIRATPIGDDHRTSLREGAMTSADFSAAVCTALESISAGRLRKVVVARDLVGKLEPGADRRRLLLELSRDYADTWTFAVDGLVGSSPETLVRVTRGAVTARVLAGSIARGQDPESDNAAARRLAESSKDLREHRFAVDSVVESLAPLSRTVAATTAPFTLQLPNLWHLASDVAGLLDDRSTALDLVAVLHPTAAVAGEPTAAAIDFINTVEPFDRRRYAGPVGWVDGHGDGIWAIALRSAEIDDDGAITAFAGAGVVAGSQPALELAETTLKFRPIVDALN